MTEAEKAFEDWFNSELPDSLSFQSGEHREVKLKAFCAGAEWAAKKAQETQKGEG